MKALAALMLAAACVTVPFPSAAAQRDRVAADMEALAVNLCQRAMNARNDTDMLAVRLVIDDGLNTYRLRIESAKSAYEKRRANLATLITARDNAENQLLAHVAAGGQTWDRETLEYKVEVFRTASALRQEESDLAGLHRAYMEAVAKELGMRAILGFVSECLELQRVFLQKQAQDAASSQPPTARQPPAVGAGDIVRCATNQGPLRCTGQFPATWQLTCARAAADDGGPAMLQLYPDGTVQAQFTSRIAGNRIDPVVGKIGADGAVLVERSDGTGGRYRWQGRFALQAPAPAIVRPIGSATLSYRGGPMDCDGHFTLLQ